MTFVGQIQAVSTQATNITYKLDDGTGLIEVKQWIDSDNPNNAASVQLVEQSYVRVWGRLKDFNSKRHVGAHVIRRIEDNNEIAMHLLEATYAHLYFTRGPPESIQPNAAAGAQTGGMFVEQNGNNSMVDMRKMTPHARKVFQLLQSAPQNNEGLHVQNIAGQLGMASNDVFKAGDELLGMGVIYTTVDDETWAVLEY